MQQLSRQDASILRFEKPRMPLHVGALMIYDPATLPGGTQRFKHILSFIEERLHLCRTFRQRIVGVPFDLDYPYWIEDRDFALEHHVHHVRLPAPGDWRQLCIQAARIHARPLDRNRPLWELTVVEGLAGIADLPEGSYAVIFKVHEAAGGVAGMDQIEALHELVCESGRRPLAHRAWAGESAPSALELMVRAQLNTMAQPSRLADVVSRAVPALGRLTQQRSSRVVAGTGPAPVTRFGRRVSAHRVVEGRRFELDALRGIRRRVPGATVNDVVLTLCGGALRRYLLAHNELPDQPLIALAPVAVQARGPKQAAGRPVAPMTVSLATQLVDPVERLTRVSRATAAARPMAAAVGAKSMTDYLQFAPSAGAAMAARLCTEFGVSADAPLPFNCVITNVPGPQVPLYSAGARLVTQFGLGPVFDGLGLSFTVFSYCGQTSIGFTACRELVPDPAWLAECLEQSFEELEQGVAATEVSVPEGL